MLRVAAFDGTNTAIADVSVSLLNVNEHAPAFERSSFAFDVSNVTRGEELVTVRATDLDRDSRVSYDFADPSTSRCRVFKTTQAPTFIKKFTLWF